MATETLPQTTISVELLPDGETPVISSRDVARHFQKKHSGILRDIDRIRSILPKSFNERNFAPVATAFTANRKKKVILSEAKNPSSNSVHSSRIFLQRPPDSGIPPGKGGPPYVRSETPRNLSAQRAISPI
ncbi:MAG: Rha family transcriptional regulator [Desulfovibrio sp.]|nr:Rha family transcriptional regulator [Desulfovibrio sp.]